jgi:hypothetical protein
MALTNTTLASPKALNDKTIKLTTATGIAAKMLVKVDAEIMRVTDISNSPTVGVVPGYAGTAAMPHGVLAPASFGLTSDYVSAYSQNPQQQILSTSFGADGPITGPAGTGTVPVSDSIIYLTKATAGAYTLALPGSGQDNILTFISTTAAAHVLTLTGNPAAADVATFAAAIGSTVTLKAQPGAWGVLASGGVTVA